MKISSFPNDINKSKKLQSFGVASKMIYMPDIVGEFGKFVGQHVSIAEKKLIQNTAATCIQPKIDMMFGDEDDKVDIAIKSTSKAIACGITGVTIRAAITASLNKNLTFDDNTGSLVRKYFMPDKALLMSQSGELNETFRRMKSYNETMGTILSILIMSTFTNKKIDVPLTRTFEELIGGVVKNNKTWHRSAYDVYKKHKEKYDVIFNKYKTICTREKSRATRLFNAAKGEDCKNQTEAKK